MRFERTGANGCEHSPIDRTQEVGGSSPPSSTKESKPKLRGPVFTGPRGVSGDVWESDET